MTQRLWRLATVAIALTLILAACGPAASTPPASSAAASSAAGSESAEATESAAAEPEIAELTVGVLPIVDVAPVYLAINDGLFEAEGLTVTPEIMQGGAAAIPALQGGDLDIAFGAWPSFLTANSAGIELSAIADGVAAAPGFTEYLALPDSGLEGNPEGLAGKTIALNTLGNLGELATRSILADAGLAWEDVTAVEMPFPDMGAALEGGSVDAIWAVEPGVTGAKSGIGAVTIIDSYLGEMEGFPVAGYFVTGDFAAENPNTVAAFTRAIQAAADMANADEQVVIDTVLTYTTLPEALVSELSFPEFRGDIDASVLQRVYDYMLEFDMGQEGLDVGSLVLGG